MTHPTADGRTPAIGPKLGDGREAEVFAWGDDAVVKLYRLGYGGYRAESAALATLDGCGVAPRLLEVVHHAGRPGLLLQRLDGTDMLTLLQSQPWRMLGLARALAEAHRAVHHVHAPADARMAPGRPARRRRRVTTPVVADGGDAAASTRPSSYG